MNCLMEWGNTIYTFLALKTVSLSLKKKKIKYTYMPSAQTGVFHNAHCNLAV